MYARPLLAPLVARLTEPRRFLQVLLGPRQVGKTTLVRQALEPTGLPSQYASADGPTLRDRVWLEQQWEAGRLLDRSSEDGALLVLDEVHKVTGWSETVKALWDQDAVAARRLRVVLLGSAPLLVRRGLAESLGGRFEVVRVPHWSYSEMREAFGWDVDRYVHFGGYPGAAPLVGDEERWAAYVRDSLIETTLARDVLLLTRVDKPALLRRLFELACLYSGQILSYTKMLGQLRDAGNTTTLAHYLDLLGGAGLVTGLQKDAVQAVRRRSSSPKLQVLNTALVSALARRRFSEARRDPNHWGRLVESAVGAHLGNGLDGTGRELLYWRHRHREVDLVVRDGDQRTAIEVKSGRRRGSLPGLGAYERVAGRVRKLLVGGDGIPLEEFLAAPAGSWVG